MFEKEAEIEELQNLSREKAKNAFCIAHTREDELIYANGHFQGVKDGYNKANEWHDLRKNPNDLPNDGELVFANNLLHTECVKFGKDKGFGISWKTDYFELSGVVFWKEIVLPKDVE